MKLRQETTPLGQIATVTANKQHGTPPPPPPGRASYLMAKTLTLGHFASYVVFLHGGFIKEVHEHLFDVSKFGFHLSLESLAHWLWA